MTLMDSTTTLTLMHKPLASFAILIIKVCLIFSYEFGIVGQCQYAFFLLIRFKREVNKLKTEHHIRMLACLAGSGLAAFVVLAGVQEMQ